MILFDLSDGGKRLVNKDISTLPASIAFKEQCNVMGFNTLKDITDKGWIALMQKKDFS